MSYYNKYQILLSDYEELEEKCEALEKALCNSESKIDEILNFVSDHPNEAKRYVDEIIAEREKL